MNVVVKYALIVLLPVACALSGCKAFYQETGVSITAGDVCAPLEVSDATDIINVRALFGMTGMRMWAARGNSITFLYTHSYTNSYLYGLVEKKGVQAGFATVGSTNDITTASNAIGELEGDASK